MDDEDLLAAHVLVNLYKRLAIGERLDGTLSEFDSDVIADGVGQRQIGVSTKYFHGVMILDLEKKSPVKPGENQEQTLSMNE